MNQELRGRLLAHIMFGELEKIATNISGTKNVLKAITKAEGNASKVLPEMGGVFRKHPAPLKLNNKGPFTYKPPSSQPFQTFEPLQPPPFVRQTAMDDLAKATDDELFNLLSRENGNFRKGQIQAELQKRRAVSNKPKQDILEAPTEATEVVTRKPFGSKGVFEPPKKGATTPGVSGEAKNAPPASTAKGTEKATKSVEDLRSQYDQLNKDLEATNKAYLDLVNTKAQGLSVAEREAIFSDPDVLALGKKSDELLNKLDVVSENLRAFATKSPSTPTSILGEGATTKASRGPATPTTASTPPTGGGIPEATEVITRPKSTTTPTTVLGDETSTVARASGKPTTPTTTPPPPTTTPPTTPPPTTTPTTTTPAEIPALDPDKVKNFNLSDALTGLDDQVAISIRNQAPNGFITTRNAEKLSPEALQKLNEAGVIVSNMDDATAASIQAFKADSSKLPVGEMSLNDAERLLGGNGSSLYIYKGESGAGSIGKVFDSGTGSAIGVVEGQNVRFFTPAERSQNKFISRMTDTDNYAKNGLSTLDEGATITANDISKASISNKELTNDIQTFKMDGKNYAYDRRQARIIGEQKADGSITGVNADEANRIQDRLNNSYANELKNAPFNVGENGLYSPEDLAKMEPGLKRQIPRSEGGLGVNTIDDFKSLETEALNAERIANVMKGTEQGVIFRAKGRLTPELEAQQRALREEYKQARDQLMKEYQDALAAHYKGTTPLSEEALKKIEGDLKYLQDRKVPYFDSNTLYSNKKGLRSPETPEGILGNKGGTLATGLGLGAVGTIGAMGMLGGGNQEEQYDPYAGQY